MTTAPHAQTSAPTPDLEAIVTANPTLANLQHLAASASQGAAQGLRAHAAAHPLDEQQPMLERTVDILHTSGMDDIADAPGVLNQFPSDDAQKTLATRCAHPWIPKAPRPSGWTPWSRTLRHGCLAALMTWDWTPHPRRTR
jgi:hypothetical protein